MQCFATRMDILTCIHTHPYHIIPPSTPDAKHAHTYQGLLKRLAAANDRHYDDKKKVMHHTETHMTLETCMHASTHTHTNIDTRKHPHRWIPICLCATGTPTHAHTLHTYTKHSFTHQLKMESKKRRLRKFLLSHGQFDLADQVRQHLNRELVMCILRTNNKRTCTHTQKWRHN